MFPLLSVISDSFATIIDKLILKTSLMSSKNFTSILFIFMWFFTLPLLFFCKIENINFLVISIICLIIVLSALQNYFFYVSLNNKDLSSLEPIRNSEPIVIILLSFLIFPDERNIIILILGVIITWALIYAHLDIKKSNKPHIIFDKYSFILIFSIFISAVLFICYKYILEFITPITLYSIRTLWVLFVLTLFFKPKIWILNKKQIYLFLLSAFFYTLSAICQYIWIVNIWLNMTIIIISLSPIIIYLSSYFLLKESVNSYQIISSFIIIICVMVAMYVY